MQYKTELHAHTMLVSPCADTPIEEVVRRYAAAGYTTVVVTDHYCDYVIDNAGEDWTQKVEHYLSGYRAMKEAAQGKFNVILGCELRFLENSNDYLVFGMDEEFLHAHPELHKMSLKAFSAFAKEHGLLLVQAHPFRNGMTMVNPRLLDGVEAFNGHYSHESKNYLANELANRYGLIKTSGTDFHHPVQQPSGGIVTNEPITSVTQLIEILKSGNYTLICQGPAAERDGMTDMPAKEN